MGQHTWFFKNGDLYKEMVHIHEKLEQKEEVLGELEYFDDLEVKQLEKRSDEIWESNQSDYHDCFRTHKRESGGSYLTEVLYSKEQCDKWLIENENFLYYVNKELVDKFWDDFPNGAINFG